VSCRWPPEEAIVPFLPRSHPPVLATPFRYALSLPLSAEKVDVYSMGIVLFEALTRESPYEGIPTMRVLSGVVRGLRPELPPHTPPPLTCLIRACWAHNPQERPRYMRSHQLAHPLWHYRLSSACSVQFCYNRGHARRRDCLHRQCSCRAEYHCPCLWHDIHGWYASGKRWI